MRGVGMLGVDLELATAPSHQAHRPRRRLGRGRALAARRARREREGGRLRARRERHAARHDARTPGRASTGLGDKTVLLAVNNKPIADRRAAGAGEVPRRRSGAAVPRVDRGAAPRVDEATGGKVGYVYVQSTGVDAQNELVRQFMAQRTKDGADHRRAVQQRRADPRSLHRAAEPSDPELLGRARRRQRGSGRRWLTAGRKVMLINGWSGSGGDAFPFYFREARTRAAHRHAYVGRAHRHQRSARPGRRRRRHRADLPHVRSEGRVVRRRPRRRSGHRVDEDPTARPRAPIRSSNGRSKKCCRS